MHRIIVLASDEDAFIGDTYAQAFITHNRDKRQNLESSIDDLVREDLIIIHGEPPPEMIARNKLVFEHTFGRQEGIIRGRLVDGDPAPEARRKAASTNKRMQLAMKFINGEIRSDVIVHYEVGCCVDAARNFCRTTCVMNVSAAIKEVCLPAGSPGDLPSKNRWGSMSEHEGQQAAGAMIHNIMPRAFASSFGQ